MYIVALRRTVPNAVPFRSLRPIRLIILLWFTPDYNSCVRCLHRFYGRDPRSSLGQQSISMKTISAATSACRCFCTIWSVVADIAPLRHNARPYDWWINMLLENCQLSIVWMVVGMLMVCVATECTVGLPLDAPSFPSPPPLSLPASAISIVSIFADCQWTLNWWCSLLAYKYII